MTCLLLELFVCFHLNCSVAIDQLCRAHHDGVSWKMRTLALNIIIIEWSSFLSSCSSSWCMCSQKDLGDHTASSLPLHCNGDLPSSCAKRATLSLYSRSCTAIYYYTATTLLLLYYYTIILLYSHPTLDLALQYTFILPLHFYSYTIIPPLYLTPLHYIALASGFQK